MYTGIVSISLITVINRVWSCMTTLALVKIKFFTVYTILLVNQAELVQLFVSSLIYLAPRFCLDLFRSIDFLHPSHYVDSLISIYCMCGLKCDCLYKWTCFIYSLNRFYRYGFIRRGKAS